MMQGPLNNPYFNKTMVRDPHLFIGRRELLKQVYEAIANCQSISLLGSRHIGLSSVLWCATLPEIQKPFPVDLSRRIFVFLDLDKYQKNTCDDFFHIVSREILAQSKKVGLTLYGEGRGLEEFSNVLDQIADNGFFPVLLMDHFHKVTLNEHFDLEFFDFLRALANARLISYVTASLAPLSEICHSGIAGSPFFNIFYQYSLEAFSPEDARTLISERARQSGLAFSKDEFALILKWAGRHPYFLQCICRLFWEEKRNVGQIQVKQLRDRVYKELAPIFEEIWKSLPESQQKVLQDEAQQKEHQQRQFPELSESSIFRLFIRTICRTGFFDLTTGELEAALKHLDDLAALGETDLRLMKLVAVRLKNQQTPTAAEKGLAIRDVLNEALQRLRGSGRQSDDAGDWKAYNILYYRFFKYRLKNEQIAARLGISVRQYYRERDEAIEALRQDLIEMELTADALDDE